MTDVPKLLRPGIEDAIHVYGQRVMGIMASPPFYYTIGNAIHGLPELLVIGGVSPEIGTLMLNVLGKKMRDEGKPLEEGMLDIDWTFPFKIRKASDNAKSEYTIQAGQFLGREDYDVLQVMICDKAGVYQDDLNCQYGAQLA